MAHATTNNGVAVLHAEYSARKDKSLTHQNYQLTPKDEAFLEDLSRRAFQFFWEQSNPVTGLTLDRARTDGSPFQGREVNRNVASIASTGFALTSYCIAVERGWTTRDEAHRRTLATLNFFASRATHEHGWFYHWMDAATGERRWQSEVSTIDTALLLAGILTAKQYFQDDKEIARLADSIYSRIDFAWMLNDHPTLLAMGYRPENGFIKSRWHTYSEHLIQQLLAIGSPTHPIPPAAWRAWSRTYISFDRYTFLVPSASPLSGNPLFVHQYPQAWIDFRGRRETWYPFTNYFENSIKATRAQRAFSVNVLAREFPASYGENLWGITASDSAKGYVAWGAPPRDPQIDGTLVPCAAGGSLMLTPDITLPVLHTMREKFGEKIYKRYGFVDAFNPTTGWIDTDVIGIDVGITLLSAENLRTGNVWRWFMRNEEIKRAMDSVGLKRKNALH
ncbi:MAG: glucoamylase family protein [Pyrinomonadaceae bacterium]